MSPHPRHSSDPCGAPRYAERNDSQLKPRGAGRPCVFACARRDRLFPLLGVSGCSRCESLPAFTSDGTKHAEESISKPQLASGRKLIYVAAGERRSRVTVTPMVAEAELPVSAYAG